MSPWVTLIAGASPHGGLLVLVPIAHLTRTQVTVIGYAKPAELDTMRANVGGLGLDPLTNRPHHGRIPRWSDIHSTVSSSGSSYGSPTQMPIGYPMLAAVISSVIAPRE